MIEKLNESSETQQYHPAEVLSLEPTFEEVQQQKERCVESVKDAAKMKEHLGELGADQRILDNPAFLNQLSIILEGMDALQEGWTPTDEVIDANGFSVSSINANTDRKSRYEIGIKVQPGGSLNITMGYASRERFNGIDAGRIEQCVNDTTEYSFTTNKDGALFLHEDECYSSEQTIDTKDSKRHSQRRESTTAFDKDGRIIRKDIQRTNGPTTEDTTMELSKNIKDGGNGVPVEIRYGYRKPDNGNKTSTYYIREKDGTITAHRSEDGKESVKINTREWHGDLAVTFGSAEAILNEEWHKKNG